MALEFSEDFEGGAPGATITASNTGYHNVAGVGARVFDNSVAVTGSQSARLTCTANTVILRRDFAARNVGYTRRYLRFAALPPAVVVIFRYRSTVNQAQMQIEADGRLSITNGVATVATTTTALAANAWYRVEYGVDMGTTSQTLRLFHGGNLHGTTPDETITATYNRGDFTMGQTGIVASSTFELWLDAMADDTATWPSPPDVEPPPEPSGEYHAQMWNGSTLVPLVMHLGPA